mgnify:CR=1 FL=1|jgi:hypothetical protein
MADCVSRQHRNQPATTAEQASAEMSVPLFQVTFHWCSVAKKGEIGCKH